MTVGKSETMVDKSEDDGRILGLVMVPFVIGPFLALSLLTISQNIVFILVHFFKVRSNHSSLDYCDTLFCYLL